MKTKLSIETASEALNSLVAVFFLFPSFSELPSCDSKDLISALKKLFDSVSTTFKKSDKDFSQQSSFLHSCAILNQIESICTERGFSFHQALINDFIAKILLKRNPANTNRAVLDFFASHLYNIEIAFVEILELLCETEKSLSIKNARVPFLNPNCELLATAVPTSATSISDELQKILGVGGSKTELSWRTFTIVGNDISPAELASIRPTNKFYGYQGARDFFKKYFYAFSEKKENIPLLITSLPGLGKTHFTISYTLDCPNLSLVLGSPYYLQEGLAQILARLKKDADRLFVLFFDDIDVKKVEWFHFRTNVGGAFVLPANVTIVIASNYEFPPNILSRGRGYSFPIFDEIRCQEMVHDFLMSFGMRAPSKELISVIAADYVEEFGQHVFEELSPRTLVRYLDRYMNDAEKRKRMLSLSKEKVVPIPDASCFLEVNRKLIEKFCYEQKNI